MAFPKKFIFTEHAQKRAKERNITREQFVEVIMTSNSKRKQYRGNNGGIVYLYTKSMDKKRLHIAAEIYKEKCFFVTGFWE